jgi:hypothetical protein
VGGAPCACDFILGLGGPKGAFVGPGEAGVVGQRTPGTVPRGGDGLRRGWDVGHICPSCDSLNVGLWNSSFAKLGLKQYLNVLQIWPRNFSICNC